MTEINTMPGIPLTQEELVQAYEAAVRAGVSPEDAAKACGIEIVVSGDSDSDDDVREAAEDAWQEHVKSLEGEQRQELESAYEAEMDDVVDDRLREWKEELDETEREDFIERYVEAHADDNEDDD